MGFHWILVGLMWIALSAVGGAALTIIGLAAIGAIVGGHPVYHQDHRPPPFKAWGWVWTVGVLFMAINVLIGIITLFSNWMTGLISIVIAAIILWYLFQPKGKAYSGKT